MNMLPAGTRIWIVAGVIDMRNGLVQNALKEDTALSA